MISICQLDPETGAFTGQLDQINPDSGCPAGWVRAAAPAAPPAGKLQIWSDGVWSLITPAAPDLDALRSVALDELADQRWRATQTFSYDGVVAPADPALGAVVGFVVGAQLAAPEGPSTWELARGVFRSWTVEQIIAYGLAIRAHIQACFDNVEALSAEVAAATTPAAIAAIVDQAGTSWPS